MRQQKPRYSAEVRQEAARRIESGESKQAVAQAMGMHQDTLENWMPHLAPPKGQKNYPKEVREEVIRRVKAGESTALIAQTMGIHRSTAERWAPTTNVPDSRSARYPKAVRDEAVRRVESGETKTSVSKALGISQDTIYDWTLHVNRAAVPTPMNIRSEAIARGSKRRISIIRCQGFANQSRSNLEMGTRRSISKCRYSGSDSTSTCAWQDFATLSQAS